MRIAVQTTQHDSVGLSPYNTAQVARALPQQAAQDKSVPRHAEQSSNTYLSTDMVHRAMKPEYDGLKQGRHATNAHLRLRETHSEDSIASRRCIEEDTT